MTHYDPHKHHRRSIRLKGWDYRAPGYYFVTICSQGRRLLFSNDDYRAIAANSLIRIPAQKHAQHVALDEWIVMPDHIHAIIIFTDYPAKVDFSEPNTGFRNALAGSLGVVVGRYKSGVTTRINALRRTKGAKAWQRGYYERIIRDERQLQATRAYIRANPARWADDHDDLDILLSQMTLHN